LCPITNTVRGWNFEVLLPNGFEITGAVLSDQVRNLSWEQRAAAYVCEAPDEVLLHVRAKIKALIGG